MNQINTKLNQKISPKITSLSTRWLPAEIRNMNNRIRARDCCHNLPSPSSKISESINHHHPQNDHIIYEFLIILGGIKPNKSTQNCSIMETNFATITKKKETLCKVSAKIKLRSFI